MHFRKRVIIIFISLSLTFFSLIMRSAYLALIEGEKLSTMTDNQYTITEPISNINFSLEDRSGKELLDYITKYYFVVDVNSFLKSNSDTDISIFKSVIYILRNYNENYDLMQLKARSTGQKMYYSIDEDTYNKLKDIKGVKGTYALKKSEVNNSYAWKYPNMLVNTIKNATIKLENNSIEKFITDNIKNNDYPKLLFQKDVQGDIASGKYKIPSSNINIRLTTDKDIEDSIKEVLSKDQYAKYDQIGVAMMDSTSGKILAMAQRDDWKPNIILCSTTENGYEPGSIFKTIVAAAALDKKGISTDYRVLCKETEKQHGYVNMMDAFTVSCNDYFRNIGTKSGFNNVIDMAKSFGLFSKVLNFNGNEEVAGDYIKDDIYNIAIGQSMRITPIQALGMVNTIVNDGVYVKPYLVDSTVDINDNILKSYSTTSNRVINSSTAQNIKSMMLSVVSSTKGTGHYAYSSKVEIGGKTGTTERHIIKKDASGNSTDEKHSDTWFDGFFKMNNKYYSMVIFVNNVDPNAEDSSITAVPVFRDIVQKLANNK